MDDQTKNKIIKEIIRRVILNTGESHRLVVQEVLDEEFINFALISLKKLLIKSFLVNQSMLIGIKTSF